MRCPHRCCSIIADCTDPDTGGEIERLTDPDYIKAVYALSLPSTPTSSALKVETCKYSVQICRKLLAC
jgi:hypothetical protein